MKSPAGEMSDISLIHSILQSPQMIEMTLRFSAKKTGLQETICIASCETLPNAYALP